MADTNHGHTHAEAIPVEGDGISYRGLVWFVAILFITTVVSQGLMVGLFKWLDHEVQAADAPRPPLAAPIGQLPPSPNLLYQSTGTPVTTEPGFLKEFRDREEAVLKGYAVDKASGVAQIPINRAKEILLQRGFATRNDTKTAVPPAAPAKADKNQSR